MSANTPLTDDVMRRGGTLLTNLEAHARQLEAALIQIAQYPPGYGSGRGMRQIAIAALEGAVALDRIGD